MTRYRILERRAGEGWKTFGVAYDRAGQIVLFAPPWRAHRPLEAATLEELDERHYPGVGYRWRAVQTSSLSVRHPIELLRQAAAPHQEDEAASAAPELERHSGDQR